MKPPLNFLAAIVLVFATPLIVLVAARVAAGFKRATVLAGLAAIGVALAIGAVATSRPAIGIVTGKTEYFEFAMRGVEPRASRRLILTVAGRELGSMRFNVEARVYDGYRVGQSAALHYLGLGPLRFGRLDAEPWWNLLPGRFERWLPLRQPVDELPCRGTIESVRTVREAYVFTWASFFGQGRDVAHISLAQPYDEIQFRFSTPAGTDIVGLDRVDSGSAGTLASGMIVSVTYPSADPHRARLALGTREHVSRNSGNYWSGQALLAAVLVAFLGLAAALRHVVRRRTGISDGARNGGEG